VVASAIVASAAAASKVLLEKIPYPFLFHDQPCQQPQLLLLPQHRNQKEQETTLAAAWKEP
jgi:hypothetical protein